MPTTMWKVKLPTKQKYDPLSRTPFLLVDGLRDPGILNPRSGAPQEHILLGVGAVSPQRNPDATSAVAPQGRLERSVEAVEFFGKFPSLYSWRQGTVVGGLPPPRESAGLFVQSWRPLPSPPPLDDRDWIAIVRSVFCVCQFPGPLPHSLPPLPRLWPVPREEKDRH